MIRHLLAASALLLSSQFAIADNGQPIRFAQTPAISPDGKLVAFSYQGDIWVVDSIGGIARPVTMHQKHEIWPSFSPDGKRIAFSSNRHGGYDVYVVSVLGGRPTRLTFHSSSDVVNGWSPDGEQVLFSSSRAATYPSNWGLYTVSATGGQVRRISVDEGRDAAFAPSGEALAYIRGPSTRYRAGYRGSSNNDIWICKGDGSNHVRVTSFDGLDGSPMWAPDGESLYYVSEKFDGPANIVRSSKHGKVPTQITNHKDESVRGASISRNGEWIVYECGVDLWILSTTTGKSRKLIIEAYADDKTNPDKVVEYSKRVSEFAMSNNEKYNAIVIHGEIFMISRSGGTATRLTDHPAFDHGVAWARDNNRIVFLSDRNGHEDIYQIQPADTNYMNSAKKFKIVQLTKSPEPESALCYAPNNSRIAFIRSGELWTMKPDGSDVKVVVKDGTVFDYTWSPDSKWICYARKDGSFASELFIVPASGPTRANPARNITRYATYNASVDWSKYNHRLAFVSRRIPNQTTAHVLSLQKPAVSGAPSTNQIDWENIHRRVAMPAKLLAYEVAISRDGDRIAFRGKSGSNYHLYVANVNGSSVTRVASNIKPMQIRFSRLLSSLLYFRDSDGNVYVGTVGTKTKIAKVPFKARMTIRRDEQFAEMFEQSWRALHDKFYDDDFHGIDWTAMRNKFRPLVKHCVTKEDLYTLIGLMLGELNASHLGIKGDLGKADQTTAELGLIFDHSYSGPGLRVAEILRRGPADKRGMQLRTGDIVLSIDGTELDGTTNVAKLLADKSGSTIELIVTSDPKNKRDRRRAKIKATTRSKIIPLAYDRWVDGNTARVAKLSKGRLGYVHIPSMNESGIRRFLRSFYSDSFNKEGIVLDVRYNGGGYTHEKILGYLTGKAHTLFSQRDGGTGLVIRSDDRRWTKPLVLLINNRSYSDAEIFAHAFRDLRLGKLVGQPTGGHVIGTGSIKLIDGSEFRVPGVGVTTSKGINLERNGVAPDHLVDIAPDRTAGDPQLVKAVEVLLREVQSEKKAGIARDGSRPSETSTNPESLPRD